MARVAPTISSQTRSACCAKLALADHLCKVWNLAELNRLLTLLVTTESVVKTAQIPAPI